MKNLGDWLSQGAPVAASVTEGNVTSLPEIATTATQSTTTMVGTDAEPLILANENRKDLIIVNYGTHPLYLSLLPNFEPDQFMWIVPPRTTWQWTTLAGVRWVGPVYATRISAEEPVGVWELI